MQIAFTSALLSKWCSFGLCQVKRIHGFNNQGASVYIQLFETSPESSSVNVSNGKVPTFKSLLAAANNGFDYDFGYNRPTFAELTIALSTTETSLTAVAASGGLDMTIDIDGLFLVDNFSGLTVVGDLTTSVTTLQVWANASGPKHLVRIDSIAVDATSNYIAGYAVDAPAATNKVLFTFALGNSSTTIRRSWEQGEALLFEYVNTPAPPVTNQGLTVQPQSIATAEANEGLHAKIRAIYF